MVTKVIKIGNSLGIIIPKKIVKSLGWKAGDTIIVHVDYNEGKIILEKKK